MKLQIIAARSLVLLPVKAFTKVQILQMKYVCAEMPPIIMEVSLYCYEIEEDLTNDNKKGLEVADQVWSWVYHSERITPSICIPRVCKVTLAGSLQELKNDEKVY